MLNHALSTIVGCYILYLLVSARTLEVDNYSIPQQLQPIIAQQKDTRTSASRRCSLGENHGCRKSGQWNGNEWLVGFGKAYDKTNTNRLMLKMLDWQIIQTQQEYENPIGLQSRIIPTENMGSGINHLWKQWRLLWMFHFQLGTGDTFLPSGPPRQPEGTYLNNSFPGFPPEKGCRGTTLSPPLLASKSAAFCDKMLPSVGNSSYVSEGYTLSR